MTFTNTKESGLENLSAPNACPEVITALAEWKGGSGRFVPAKDLCVIVEKGSALEAVAALFADGYEAVTQRPVEVKSGSVEDMAAGDIYLGYADAAAGLGEEGYFCDIQWVTQNDKRYAVLIYNGLWARTFTIYDLDRQTEYYAHEDGNGVITSIFKNYNNTGVEFYEDSPVIYRLMGKEDDHLKIGFAINAKDNTSINGEYVYNTVSESITGFNYSQSSNQ